MPRPAAALLFAAAASLGAVAFPTALEATPVPLDPPLPPGSDCNFSTAHAGEFLAGYANNTREVFADLAGAQARCLDLGGLCGGVTLEKGAAYTPRRSGRPAASASETSWVKNCPRVELYFLSAVFGDHMVLQRAPQRAMLWGHTRPGAKVTTTFSGAVFVAVADKDGTWRQQLPPVPASAAGHTITFNSSTGESAALADVLFGEVFICSGQSNMGYPLDFGTNATSEIQAAGAHPTIRVFNVGQHNQSNEAFDDLQAETLPWAVASNTTVPTFSAVCWFFGRQVSQHLPGVPLGLVESAWGATSIQQWMPKEAFVACNNTRSKEGKLYNSMIYPFAFGPMALAGFAWYQGENNVKHYARDYDCMQTAMINAWREAFRAPDAFFGFVQLSTYCADYAIQRLPQLREQQMASLKLPNVGYATNVDHGAGCYIHPPSKQFCGARLGNAALALRYGKDIAWRSPSYAAAEARVEGGAVSVVVNLTDVTPAGLTTDVYPHNYIRQPLGKIHYDPVNCTELNDATPGMCAWASVEVVGAGWLNATVAAAAGGRSLVLSAPLPLGAGRAGPAVASASAYGWGPIPLMNAYDKGSSLPVLPWNRTLPAR